MSKSVPFYDPRFKAYKSHDYLFIEPLVLAELERRKYPALITLSSIFEVIIQKISDRITEIRAKHCISRSLMVAGYDRGSDRGEAYYKTEPIRRVDTREISLSHRLSRKSKKPSVFVKILNYFFPTGVEPQTIDRTPPKPRPKPCSHHRKSVTCCLTLAAFG